MAAESDAGIEICQHVSVANFIYYMYQSLLFFNESSETGSNAAIADKRIEMSSFGLGVRGNGTVSGYGNASVQLNEYSTYDDYSYDSGGGGSGTVADVLMYSLQRSPIPTWLPHSIPFYDDIRPTIPLSSSHDNVTDGGGETSGTSTGSPAWFRLVIPTISAVGIVGNLLNIAVLTRRRLLSTMQRLELSVTHGLTALAISDLLFCVTVLPQGFVDDNGGRRWTTDSPLTLLYRVYSVALANLLMMQSTWLVTMMAACRYLVVVYPLQARQRLTGHATMASIGAVMFVSFIISSPHFLLETVDECRTLERPSQPPLGTTISHFPPSSLTPAEHRNLHETDVLTWPQSVQQLRHFEIVSVFRGRKAADDMIWFYVRWVWPIWSTFIPLAALGAFNVRLVRELNAARRLSTRTRSVNDDTGHTVIEMTSYATPDAPAVRSTGTSITVRNPGNNQSRNVDDGLTIVRTTSAGRKVTLTLVGIILMNLGLVTPSELVKYVNPYAGSSSTSTGHLVIDIANALQAFNFAVNFFLYCVLNPHFRLTITRMFCCRDQRTGCASNNVDVARRRCGAFQRLQFSTVVGAGCDGQTNAAVGDDVVGAAEFQRQLPLTRNNNQSCHTEFGLLISGDSPTLTGRAMSCQGLENTK